MPRVKRGKIHLKKRRSLLKKTKGYKWGRKNQIKKAKEAVVKAGAHAYRDRRKKKRTARSLWQIRLNAFVREQGLTYSRFINILKKQNIEIDRKVLADLAMNNKPILSKIIQEINKTDKVE